MAAKRTPRPEPASKKDTALPLTKVIDLFLLQCRSRNLSDQTTAWYERRLGAIHEGFATLLGQAPALADFTVTNFRQVMLTKQTGGVYQDQPFHRADDRAPSSAYIHQFFRIARAFGNWLEHEELVDPSPMRKLRMPKLVEKQLRSLTDVETKRLLETYSENSPSGCRVKAILMLMVDASLRRGEIVNLKFSDLHIDGGQHWLRVVGKGEKERIVPFGFKTAQVFQRYVSFYRPEPISPRIDSFFLNADGDAITVNALKMLIEQAAKNADVPRLHAHLLRHTYGLRTHELGVDPLDLQARMGHASVRTTQRYAHAAESERLKSSQVSYLDQLPIKVKKAARGKQG